MPFDLSSAKPMESGGGFDLASAKPVGGGTAPKPKQEEEESPYTIGNLAGGALEPMLSMATSGPAAIAGGIGGLGQAMLKAGGLSQRDPADVVRSVQGALTYEPKTAGGKAGMEVIGYPFRKLAEGSEAAGRKVQDITGSPGLAAQTETLGKFLPNLLVKGKPGEASAPRMTPAVRELSQKDVSMTPGQILGGGWNKVEQTLGKLPIIGSPIARARNRSIEDFQRAGINDALQPIGEKLPAGMKGNEAIGYAYDKMKTAYGDLLTKMRGSLDGPIQDPSGPLALTGPETKPTLRGELANITQMIDSSTMPRKYKQELNRIIDEEVIKKFTDQGRASGETLKAIDETLGDLAKKKAQSDIYDVRQQGLALQEANAAVRRMIDRENPKHAEELKAADTAYAKFKIAQRAAASIGATEGVPTPAQYLSSVRASDKSKDKRAFAEGGANQQSLGQAGKGVLGDTLRDSGTPTQLAILEMLLGGGGHLIGGPGTMAAMMAAPLMYSRPGVSAMERLITNPPRIAPIATRGAIAGQTARDE